MMTQRDRWVVRGCVAAPLSIALIGHALHMGGPLLGAVVAVVAVACAAAAVSVAWRSP
jgi:hypothetical protein